MKIEDFAKERGLKILVTKHPGCFRARFENLEIKEGSTLRGPLGEGKTKSQAMRDLARQYSGRTVVAYAYTKNREDFTAPELS